MVLSKTKRRKKEEGVNNTYTQVTSEGGAPHSQDAPFARSFGQDILPFSL